MKNIHIILGAPKEEPIRPLIKEEGLVIGVDRGALLALEEEIKVDIALGDFDSISVEEKKRIHSTIETVLDFPSDKDDTDAELALLYVLEHYSNSNVYLYNWHGGRIDHMYSILLIAVQDRFKKLIPKLIFVSTKNQISYYQPGTHVVRKIKTMQYISLILLSEVKGLSLNDMKYTLYNEDFKHPMALISNEFLEDEANFSFCRGIVAVVQSRD